MKEAIANSGLLLSVNQVACQGRHAVAGVIDDGGGGDWDGGWDADGWDGDGWWGDGWDGDR